MPTYLAIAYEGKIASRDADIHLPIILLENGKLAVLELIETRPIHRKNRKTILTVCDLSKLERDGFLTCLNRPKKIDRGSVALCCGKKFLEAIEGKKVPRVILFSNQRKALRRLRVVGNYFFDIIDKHFKRGSNEQALDLSWMSLQCFPFTDSTDVPCLGILSSYLRISLGMRRTGKMDAFNGLFNNIVSKTCDFSRDEWWKIVAQYVAGLCSEDCWAEQMKREQEYFKELLAWKNRWKS